MAEYIESAALGLFRAMVDKLFPKGASQEEMFELYDACVEQVKKHKPARSFDSDRPSRGAYNDRKSEGREYKPRASYADRGERSEFERPKSKAGVYASRDEGDERPRRPKTGGFDKKPVRKKREY